MKLVGLVAIGVLSACASSDFLFRGYNEHSNCTDVIGAERRLGATFVSSRTEDLGNLGLIDVTRMNTSLFGVSMFVDVGCRMNDEIWSIWYVALPNDIDSEAEAFNSLSAGLRGEFGDPNDFHGAAGRTEVYRCDDTTSLVLCEGNKVGKRREQEVTIHVQTTRRCGLY